MGELLSSDAVTSRARVWIFIGVVLAAVIGGAYVFHSRRVAAEDAVAAARAERAERRARRRSARWDRIRRESAERMPSLLDGVALGMSIAELRSARPAIAERPVNPSEPGAQAFGERFENGAQAVYVFIRGEDILERVQVLSLLPRTEAVRPHFDAMNDRYGAPSGVWDCPDTDGAATRRFTWRGATTTVSDVFLIVRGRVSVTLYIAPNEVIGRSLQRSRCHPVRREDLDRFPVSDPSRLNVDL